MLLCDTLCGWNPVVNCESGKSTITGSFIRQYQLVPQQSQNNQENSVLNPFYMTGNTQSWICKRRND